MISLRSYVCVRVNVYVCLRVLLCLAFPFCLALYRRWRLYVRICLCLCDVRVSRVSM